ncbi:hypothetical protein M9Y10_027555 [Tritrichomonas musculus]|uniref:Bromo domain-containing protein n=2 Tax=Tritrichomonas musculus TaxID=1915356 RepID=A0ABR2GKU2_9EUKA
MVSLLFFILTFKNFLINMNNRRCNMSCSQVCKEQFYHICQDIVQQIVGTDGSSYFFRPVDPEKDGAPDYYLIIMTPMSLFDVQDKLDKKLYNTPEEFIKDMDQIFINAKIYNMNTHPIYKAAEVLANKFSILSARLPRKIQDLNSGLQCEVELRLLRYRLNKKTHL